MLRPVHWVLAGGLSLILLTGGGLAAQDVELLGRLHGTRPPQGYYDLIRRYPYAYQYQRALVRRGLRLREPPPVRVEGQAMTPVFSPVFAGPLAAGEPRAPVAGSFRFPLILGLFSDSDSVPSQTTNAREVVQREYFDGPQVNPNAAGTIPELYSELSGGLVELSGMTFDWQRTNLSRAQVTAGESGLGQTARTSEFIIQILQALDDGTVDWGRFDNDGPDGLPNSGDDDGYVDVLTVMHPTPGGECSHPDRPYRIWSHRWDLFTSALVQGFLYSDTLGNRYYEPWATPVVENRGYLTRTPRSPGGDSEFVRILDYTIQPVLECRGENLNTIGVFAHELGHGFGLPDLYGVGGNHAGIGNWGLMGTGSWGCDGISAGSPCHMSAWSKSVLGWVDVETLPVGTDLQSLSLPPVETSRRIYRIDSGDGSGEYLLLENRQRTGFDRNLYAPGLLVWHIDPATIAAGWEGNRINADPERLGVWLLQADGADELARSGGGRGDAGDPFPGAAGRTELHAGTRPGSWTHDGAAMGATLLDIRHAAEEMAFQAVTGYQPLTIRTEGAPSGKGLVSVDEVTSEEPEWVFWAAPFQMVTISAGPGEEIEAGIRVGFEGWIDGGARVREHETGLVGDTFTAVYGGREVHLEISLFGPVEGITPGSIAFSPGDEEGWVGEGETVLLSAEPRTGFGFVEWTGILAGRPNPTTLLADRPLEAGAVFDLTFSTASNPGSLEIPAATTHYLTLAVDNANPPVAWTLVFGPLPEGMALDPIGRITGAAMERGTFPLRFHVRDGIGLEGELSLELLVLDPEISIERLASPFLLSGASLDLSQRTYLDREGNRNGAYDLGDFRAFFLRNPDLPLSGDMRGIIELLVPLGGGAVGHAGGGSGREGVR